VGLMTGSATADGWWYVSLSLTAYAICAP